MKKAEAAKNEISICAYAPSSYHQRVGCSSFSVNSSSSILDVCYD